MARLRTTASTNRSEKGESDVAHNALGAGHRAVGRHRNAVQDHERALALANDWMNWRSDVPARIGLARGDVAGRDRYAGRTLDIQRSTGNRAGETRLRALLAGS